MKKELLFNLIFWLLLWLVFFLSLIRLESSGQALLIASILIFPMIIPVYIHNFIFEYFIYKKKYVLYLVTTGFIILFFGYIINELQSYITQDGSSETYGSLLFIMILYTGAKYFRMGTQQRMRLKEEEEKRIGIEFDLKELEAKQSQAELNLLKSQVNPHFLFNSLNSIYSLILSQSDDAAETVLKLSDLMRYLLESSKKRKVLVKHELDFLQNYIDLEKIRLGKKAKVETNFTGELGGKIISPLLLIPFIENCFKHGIGVNPKDNLIQISAQIDENELRLHTINNIAAKRLNPKSKKESTGIENVKKRLQLLYPNKFKLDIKTEDKKYIVNFNIQI
jgi:two-component system, LytTR family, sensor kinase